MDKCIDKFLVNYNQGNVERHSDSSDFDDTQTVPFISQNDGTHSLFHKKLVKHSKAKQKYSLLPNPTNNKDKIQPHVTMSDDNMIPVRDDACHKKNRKQEVKANDLNSREDEVENNKQLANHNKVQEKPTPCYSHIFRRPYNNAKQISGIKETPEGHLDSGKVFCADCERRRIKKLNRRRQSYVVQPVLAVDNVQGGPVSFGHANDRTPLSQRNHKVMKKQDSNTSYKLTSSESEIEKKDQRKRPSHRRNFVDRFQKEMRKEYLKYEKEILRNRIQQYPSKRDYHYPCQVFSTPYCQAHNNMNIRDANPSNIPSTSSGFWEYLFEKIRGKHMEKCDVSKPCYCLPQSVPPPHQQQQEQQQQLQQQQQQLQQIVPCSPEDCVHFGKKSEEINVNPKELVPECKSCMQQTEEGTESLYKMQQNAKKTGPQNVKCKCYSNKKRKQATDSLKYSQKSMTPADDVNRPCQEPHDDITRAIEEKYNGEILCIHNPPCILINGCLNLPAATETAPTQGNFWPVTQDKKSSFYHICRKIKRPKTGRIEQAIQYHPPSIEVQQALQIKTEKIVQSICNHNPPCEVVYGCYKPKYDPKLDNSCVHVPMCQRLAECLMEDKQERPSTKLCEHKPKCKEIPLCSRKFVVLTAKGTVGTQVRPKTKLVCRHEPPCIMIPKCLARIISDSYIPYEAIPDCVHQPCCDMIPACCRKAAKDMPTITSVEEGLSLKLPRVPPSHRNRLLEAIRRSRPKTK